MVKFSDMLHEHYSDNEGVLVEKLIMIKNGAKYGQIVFLSGGAGSGKGFVGSQFMEANKFKVRDVDELKKAVLRLSEIKGKFPEVKGLNLRTPQDVAKLHIFVKNKGFSDKMLDGLLTDLKQDRLPNIFFDITGKSHGDFEEYVPMLKDVGYDVKDMHLVWVMTDFKVAYKNNLERTRVVPADIFLQTHKGAGKTMTSVIEKQKLPAGMNGAFHVVLNNRNQTQFYEIGDEYKGRKVTSLPIHTKGPDIGKTMKIVKGFEYITLKREGKPFLKPNEYGGDFLQKVADAINANLPSDDAHVHMDRIQKEVEAEAKAEAAKK